MVCAKIAEQLSTPIWMEHDDNECRKSKALSCQVTNRLYHHELFIVVDEVRGNICMKGYITTVGRTSQL